MARALEQGRVDRAEAAPQAQGNLGDLGRWISGTANSDRSTQRPESLTIVTDRLPNEPCAS